MPDVRGIVLAAGGGTRLRPLTDRLPKTLLEPADDGRSILELAIANLEAAGVEAITVVTGHRAEAIEETCPYLESRYEVDLALRYNPHHATMNNAYSVWCVRDVLAQGAILVNGDTVHPGGVEQALLAARGRAPILLALDEHKSLGDEEMKVQLVDGRLRRISKHVDPARADGEYIGVSLIEAAAADELAAALQRTFEHDPDRYYEDGYQEFVDRGGVVETVSIGAGVPWIEVDDHADLARARRLLATHPTVGRT